MIRGHKGLSSNNLFDESSGDDPMAGVANLVDAMLVFACGLMLAIITKYNVNLKILDVEMTEVTQDIQIMETDDSSSGSGTAYNELGMVYQDPETGQMYLISGN